MSTDKENYCGNCINLVADFDDSTLIQMGEDNAPCDQYERGRDKSRKDHPKFMTFCQVKSETDNLENEIRHGEMGHPRGEGIEVPADGKMREFELTESENKVELPPINADSSVVLVKETVLFESDPNDFVLPMPEKKIADDECQQCGAKITPGQNFCEGEYADCEIRYAFSGVSDGVYRRYLKVMENVKLFKERNART